jgi:hypothetical protein
VMGREIDWGAGRRGYLDMQIDLEKNEMNSNYRGDGSLEC